MHDKTIHITYIQAVYFFNHLLAGENKKWFRGGGKKSEDFKSNTCKFRRQERTKGEMERNTAETSTITNHEGNYLIGLSTKVRISVPHPFFVFFV